MPGFEIFGEEEKNQISDVLETGVLFRYEFTDQRKGIYSFKISFSTGLLGFHIGG